MSKIYKGAYPLSNTVSVPKNLEVMTVATISDLWGELGNMVSSGYNGHILQGQSYIQGNRLFFNTSTSVETLLDVASVRTASKKDTVEEVIENYNRPTEAAHLTKTAAYIREEAGKGGPFILPAFILNVGTHSSVIESDVDDDDFQLPPPRLIVVEHPGVVQAAVLVLPAGIKLPVIDGAHRVKGFHVVKKKLANGKDADPMALKRVMANAVPLIIGFEESLAQVHQDFADCAQTKPMAASVKSTYDTRDRAATAARSVLQGNPWLMEHVDGTAAGLNVSATSSHIYTLAALRSHAERIRELDVANRTEHLTDAALTDFWSKVLTHLDVFKQLLSGAAPSDVRLLNGGSVWLKPAGLSLLARSYWHAPQIEAEKTAIKHATLLTNLAKLDDALLQHGKTMEDWSAAAAVKGGFDVTKQSFVNPLWSPFWYTSRERASIRSNNESVSAVWNSVVAPACGFSSSTAAAA